MARGYVKVENVSASDIVANLKFDLDSYDDVGRFMTIDEFIEKKDCFDITCYDGSPFLELDGKMTENTEIWMWFDSVVISDQYIITLDQMKNIFGNRVRILWVERQDR